MAGSKNSVLALVLVNIFAGIFVNGEWHDDAGPWVIATKGEPWPLPLTRELDNYYYQVDHATFRIQVIE